jgi:predicted nucleotidyltransferase
MGYVAWFKKKAEEKEALREEAFKEAQRLSALLHKEFPFEALYLIGSVIKGKGFTRHSDIDFVVRGLQEDLFFKAFAFLLKNSRFDIDLKPWEELDEKSKKTVEREGGILS